MYDDLNHRTLQDPTYRKAFMLALFLHCFLAMLLLFESSHKQAVLQKADHRQNTLPSIETNHIESKAEKNPEPLVKAVSVDTTAVMATVERLKQERAAQLRAEQVRQRALQEQAKTAHNLRLAEQKRLAKLKEEATALAIARKKQMELEQQHLKQLAAQKTRELQQLETLKEKQKQLEKAQQETENRLKLQKEADEKATLEKQQANEKIAAEAEKQRLAALEAEKAAKNAAFIGEVNKYKALIISAISQQWILPEKIDRSLSSQFRIRLAPDGAVLEVRLTRSSGDPVLDHSAQTAIHKASPLPVPGTPEAFEPFRDISLTVRPENVRR
ncbi:MAG: cell envelope integrity protein TolA [Legionella sp.]|nr:cell envelope integrity protein TolA [Legionella sp.]